MALTPLVKYVTSSPADFDDSVFAASIDNRLERMAMVQQRRNGGNSSQSPVSGVAAFSDRFDAENFEQWLRARLGANGGPVGHVTFHLCPHALGEEPTVNCRDDPVAEYRENTE